MTWVRNPCSCGAFVRQCQDGVQPGGNGVGLFAGSVLHLSPHTGMVDQTINFKCVVFNSRYAPLCLLKRFTPLHMPVNGPPAGLNEIKIVQVQLHR